MNQINELYSRLDDLDSLNGVRIEIAELIKSFLSSKSDSINNWEKLCIAQAIGSLTSNLAISTPNSSAWLRICLISVSKANLLKEHRSNEYPLNDKELDKISYRMLKEAIDSIT